MTVSSKYEIIQDLQCGCCDFVWNACIEYIEIDLDELCYDCLFADNIVCPNCQIVNYIDRENEY